MKDYYKLDDKFILNYKVEKNNIIVKFTNGEKLKADKDNASLVNLIMKQQVKKLDKESLIKDENKLIKWNIFLTIFAIIGAFATLMFSFSNLLITLIIGVVSFVGVVSIFENISKLSKINDNLKNIEFVENEELINEELKNEDVLINSPRKVKKVVKKRKDKPAFDINNIDKLSLKELKELLMLIEKIKYLTSDVDVKEEDIEKTKKLTMNK